MKITEELFNNQDLEYKEFISKLNPTIDKSTIIGVRVPITREIAKKYLNDNETIIFINNLPHKYFDENMVHGLIISYEKDYNKLINKIDMFLPYVDNWAVCDSMNPKIFKKNKDKLIIDIKRWIKSKDTFTVRFGIDMLMGHYLDNEFNKEYLELANIKSNEYYINMVIAWFYATSLSKKWDYTINYITEYKLDKWVHNKTIQKAIESNRITKEQKDFLRKFKIK